MYPYLPNRGSAGPIVVTTRSTGAVLVILQVCNVAKFMISHGIVFKCSRFKFIALATLNPTVIICVELLLFLYQNGNICDGPICFISIDICRGCWLCAGQ